MELNSVQHYRGLSGAGPDRNAYGYFRVAVPRTPGVLRIYAAGFYELYIHAEFTAFGPLKSAPPFLYYDEFPVCPAGDGEPDYITVKVHRRDGQPVLWAEFRAEDGRTLALDWQGAWSRAYDTASPRLIGDTGFAEYYDFAAREDCWAHPGSNVHFRTATDAGPVPPDLVPRPLPLFRVVTRRAVSIASSPEGDGAWIADFGSMVYGRVRLSAVSSTGLPVTLGYMEDMRSGWANTEGHGVMYEDRLLHAPVNFMWRGFFKRGFRYLRISGVASVKTLYVEEYPYPVEWLGAFHCSDGDLNRIWTLSLRTLALCMDDIYNDCPHRDQAQWMDAFVSAKTALEAFGVTGLTRKCLIQHGICSFSDGMMKSPSIVPGDYLPDYALVQVMFMLWYYQVTGDAALLDELFDNTVSGFRYLERFTDSDGLIRDIGATHYLYLDNAFELCRLGKSAALNALYYGALNAMARIASILRRPDEEFRTRAEQVKNAFLHTFRKADGTLRDSDSRGEQAFRMLNFSCLFHRFTGDAARVEMAVDSPSARTLVLQAGAYAEYRVICNTEECFRSTHGASWRAPAPCYAPDTVSVPLVKGRNLIVFEVRHNDLNWELFLSPDPLIPHRVKVSEIAWDTGKRLSETAEVNTLPWFPPELSQTTHGYAAFCGLLDDPEILKRLCVNDYPRNCHSVRIPDFCRVTESEAELRHWILPCNTPWTAFYFLSALFQHALGGQALDWIRMAWGCMLRKNAVNTWEEFGTNASLCHAWGSVPAHFFLHDILGVQLESGRENVLVLKPDLCGLESAEGHVALPGNTGEVVQVSLNLVHQETLIRLHVPSAWRVEPDFSRLVHPRLVEWT